MAKPIIDKPLLALWRQPGYCECCLRWCKDGTAPHHIFGRGAGGGKRFDLPMFLIRLCPLTCHPAADQKRISRETLLKIVAEREGCRPEEIEQKFQEMRSYR